MLLQLTWGEDCCWQVWPSWPLEVWQIWPQSGSCFPCSWPRHRGTRGSGGGTPALPVMGEEEGEEEEDVVLGQQGPAVAVLTVPMMPQSVLNGAFVSVLHTG